MFNTIFLKLFKKDFQTTQKGDRKIRKFCPCCVNKGEKCEPKGHRFKLIYKPDFSQSKHLNFFSKLILLKTDPVKRKF